METYTDAELGTLGVGVAHFFGGGAYIKETFIPEGTSLAQHEHPHDHLSYLVSGRVALTVDNEVFPMQGPCAIKIKAGKTHEVHAYTAAVWLCVWSSDCTDPTQIDKVLTQKPVKNIPQNIPAKIGDGHG